MVLYVGPTPTQAGDLVTKGLLDQKAPTSNPTFTGTVSGVTKAHVGLSNVDNTADSAKPVSTAQAAADTAAKARGNHTGTQTASTISDFNTAAQADAALPGRLRGATQGQSEPTDWNTAITNGWYTANNATNAPGAGWYLGTVEAHNNTYVTQTLHAFTADTDANTNTWRRSLNAGTWTAWFKLSLSVTEVNALIVAGITGKADTGHTHTTAQVGGLDAALVAASPVGSVVMHAGIAAPAGYLLCNGAAVSRTTYAALYAALGAAASPWGLGDGSTTFNVPDFTDRSPVGAGTVPLGTSADGGAIPVEDMPVYTGPVITDGGDVNLDVSFDFDTPGATKRVLVGTAAATITPSTPRRGVNFIVRF